MPTILSSSSRRWGVKPFVIRAPPEDKCNGRPFQWFDDNTFIKKLSPELQRDYAKVFRVPNADSLQSEDLAYLFCTFNKLLPMLPIHTRSVEDYPVGYVYSRRSDYQEGLRQIFLQKAGPGVDVPWLPKSSAIPECLVPAQDYVYVSQNSRKPKDAPNFEPAWAPPIRIEHELVYPPRAPVIGRDEDTGRDIFQPLSQDWLRVMLEEQEAHHEALKSELQASVASAKEAAAEVTMAKAMLKDEEKAFSAFFIVIERVCGLDVVESIEEMADFGMKHGFFESVQPQNDEDEPESGNEDRNEDRNEDSHYEGTDSEEVDNNPKTALSAPNPLSSELVQVPEVPNLPEPKDQTDPLNEASVSAVPQASQDSPLSALVSRWAERIFPLKRRRDDDDDDIAPVDHNIDNPDKLEPDARPHKKQHLSTSGSAAQLSPPSPTPRSCEPEIPRFLINTATGEFTLNPEYVE